MSQSLPSLHSSPSLTFPLQRPASHRPLAQASLARHAAWSGLMSHFPNHADSMHDLLVQSEFSYKTVVVDREGCEWGEGREAKRVSKHVGIKACGTCFTYRVWGDKACPGRGDACDGVMRVTV